MKILSNKKYNELILKSCRGMFGAVTDDILLRDNALLNEENKQLKDNWNKLKEYLNYQSERAVGEDEYVYDEIYNEMLEIERGVGNVKNKR